MTTAGTPQPNWDEEAEPVVVQAVVEVVAPVVVQAVVEVVAQVVAVRRRSTC